jgi:hypothetical protein
MSHSFQSSLPLEDGVGSLQESVVGNKVLSVQLTDEFLLLSRKIEGWRDNVSSQRQHNHGLSPRERHNTIRFSSPYRNKSLPLLREISVGNLGDGVRELKLDPSLRDGHQINDPALDRIPIACRDPVVALVINLVHREKQKALLVL